MNAFAKQCSNFSKLETVIKTKDFNLLKKIKPVKAKDSPKSSGNDTDSKPPAGKRRKEARETEKQPVQLPPEKIDSNHCRIVCKGLLTLLLNVDHSYSADMFLLSCKVSCRFVAESCAFYF